MLSVESRRHMRYFYTICLESTLDFRQSEPRIARGGHVVVGSRQNYMFFEEPQEAARNLIPSKFGSKGPTSLREDKQNAKC